MRASRRDFTRDSLKALVDAVETAAEGTDFGVAALVLLEPDLLPPFLLNSSFHAFHAS